MDVMDDIPKPIPNNPTRFMDQVRANIRARHLAYKTEKTYCFWITRYIHYHRMKHPREMSEKHVEQFLHHLAVVKNVSPATQKTALNALAFLYNKFLEQPLLNLSFTAAKKCSRVPVVFSHEEAVAVIEHLSHPWKLLAELMYGAGLRTNEAIKLRVKDVDFAQQMIIVRFGKGAKDRRTVLPLSLFDRLQQQVTQVKQIHAVDLANGVDGVYMPYALAKKYPSAAHELAWQSL